MEPGHNASRNGNCGIRDTTQRPPLSHWCCSITILASKALCIVAFWLESIIYSIKRIVDSNHCILYTLSLSLCHN